MSFIDFLKLFQGKIAHTPSLRTNGFKHCGRRKRV